MSLALLAGTAIGAASLYTVGPYAYGLARRGIHWKGRAHSRQVALTFDDGPDPRYTPRCLEILAAHHIHATFFLVGERVRRHPELARRIKADGHDVGNHTWSHQYHWSIAPRRAIQEVREGAMAIAAVTGEPPRFYRPTWGVMNLFSYLEATRLGERCILWSIAANDWEAGNDMIAESVCTRLEGGAIVLLHDAGGADGAPEAMLRALPEIIREAQRQGLQLVSLTELLDGARVEE